MAPGVRGCWRQQQASVCLGSSWTFGYSIRGVQSVGESPGRGEARKPSFLGKPTAPFISFASIMVIIVPLGPALYSLQSAFTFTGLPYVSASEVRQDCHPSIMVKGTKSPARQPAVSLSCFQRRAAKHRFPSRRCILPTGRVGLSELTLHQLWKSHERLLRPSLSPSSCWVCVARGALCLVPGQLLTCSPSLPHRHLALQGSAGASPCLGHPYRLPLCSLHNQIPKSSPRGWTARWTPP